MTEITDEFEVTIGKGFIVGSKTKRKGALCPEPYDANRVEDWLIQELNLESSKQYVLKISASIKEMEK
jgi:hypothetical protein